MGQRRRVLTEAAVIGAGREASTSGCDVGPVHLPPTSHFVAVRWKGILSDSWAIRNSVCFSFRLILGQTWPQHLSRTTGVVLQCRLHQKSSPQTNSKAISWQFGILRSPTVEGWLALSDGRTGEGVFGSFHMVLIDLGNFGSFSYDFWSFS